MNSVNGVVVGKLPLALYFLRLGAIGFGGPVALANHMRRDLVETRGWLTEAEYEDGLAIATACPGPLAYQLGVYCGFVRHGLIGALSVAISFALAPFSIVCAIAALYLHYSDSWELRAVFHSIAPVVVALITKACWQLGRKTLKHDAIVWSFALTAVVMTLLVRKELVTLFILAGLAGSLLLRPPGRNQPPGRHHSGPVGRAGAGMALGGIPSVVPPLKLFGFFFKTGLLVFGSGLVIAPFLKAYVVDQYHWLSDTQFLDALAVGLISPGPVVITATFVGYLLAGLRGALEATLGIFTPAILFTVIAAPVLRRLRSHPQIQGFIRGIVAAVIGTLAGTSVLVAHSALNDLFSVALCALALAAVLKWPRLPEPALIAVAASAGLAFYWVSG